MIKYDKHVNMINFQLKHDKQTWQIKYKKSNLFYQSFLSVIWYKFIKYYKYYENIKSLDSN